MIDQLLKISTLQWVEVWMVEAFLTMACAGVIGFIAYKTARLITENKQ
jgi:hypothetical protein